ncbi:MAG: DUF4129 domain-containing protein [Jatrophihabitantaceae bacterium]
MRDRWLLALAGLGFAVVCVAANAARMPSGQQHSSTPLVSPSSSASTAKQPTDELDPVRSSHWHVSMPWWVVERLLILLLGVALLLLIVLIVRLVPRLEFRRARRVAEEEPVEYAPAINQRQVAGQVTAALDDTLIALRRGDRQRAIIVCWIRLEQVAEAAGFARLDSETSSELADRWLARLPLSRQPLLTLAELYREARYSSHPMPESALETARATLEQLRRELVVSAGREPV